MSFGFVDNLDGTDWEPSLEGRIVKGPTIAQMAGNLALSPMGSDEVMHAAELVDQEEPAMLTRYHHTQVERVLAARPEIDPQQL